MLDRRKRMTVPRFRGAKAAGRPLCVVTAYDYPTAYHAAAAGVDALLVGDSLAMVVQGRPTTLGVTLEAMIYHGEMVVRGAPEALVIVDLPFGAYHESLEQTIRSGVRVIKETGAPAVKLEGGAARCDRLRALVEADVPVMAHCGMLPQGVHRMGGYRRSKDVERLVEDVQAVEAAGAFAVVLECTTPEAAKAATAAVSIPTIGIGAGPHCDGQVAVIHDLVGLTVGDPPPFAKQYEELGRRLEASVTRFRESLAGPPGDAPRE